MFTICPFSANIYSIQKKHWCQWQWHISIVSFTRSFALIPLFDRLDLRVMPRLKHMNFMEKFIGNYGEIHDSPLLDKVVWLPKKLTLGCFLVFYNPCTRILHLF